MKIRIGLLCAGAFVSSAAFADTTPAPAAAPAAAPAIVLPTFAPAPAAPAMSTIVLPPNTEIALTVPEPVTSKKMKEGDVVAVKTQYDVMQNGVIVIPKGTAGTSRVTWRSGKGVFGKSAKFEISYDSLTLSDGRKLALAGKHRQEGQGNTGATVGAVVAVGLVGGLFITGKSATIVPGQSLLARTGEAASFTVAADAPRTTTAAPAEMPVAAPAATPAPAAVPATTPTTTK